MKKVIEEIIDTIESKETERRLKNATFKANRSTYKSNIEGINERLSETDNLDEYTKLNADLQKYQTALILLDRGEALSKKDGYYLPIGAYKMIRSDLESELDELKKEVAPKIAKLVSEIVDILDEYSDRADELSDLNRRAFKLYSSWGEGGNLERNELFNDGSSSDNANKILTRAYFKGVRKENRITSYKYYKGSSKDSSKAKR